MFDRSSWPHQHFSCHIKISLVPNTLCSISFYSFNLYFIIYRLLFFISFFIFFLLFVFFIFDIFLRLHPCYIYYCWILLFYYSCKFILFCNSFSSKIYCVWIDFFLENAPFKWLYFFQTFFRFCFFIWKLIIYCVMPFLCLWRPTYFLFLFGICFS